MLYYIYIGAATFVLSLVVALKHFISERDEALAEIAVMRSELQIINHVDRIEYAIMKAKSDARNAADDYEANLLKKKVDISANFGDPRINILQSHPN